LFSNFDEVLVMPKIFLPFSKMENARRKSLNFKHLPLLLRISLGSDEVDVKLMTDVTV
jgi:hypothetical protein